GEACDSRSEAVGGGVEAAQQLTERAVRAQVEHVWKDAPGDVHRLVLIERRPPAVTDAPHRRGALPAGTLARSTPATLRLQSKAELFGPAPRSTHSLSPSAVD